jgi:molybdopterin/thiamine biosynthesis adenylyltransferase
MARWHESYPERLAFELAEFDRRGLSFVLDEQRLKKTGQVVLVGSVEHDGRRIDLQIAYPDSFPFLRPEVFAPGIELERHQNPIERNLCLLDRSTRAWSVADTGAWLVDERVPFLLSLLAAGGEQLRAGEAPQGEPQSIYFRSEPGAVVFVPEQVLALTAEHRVGLLQIALGENEPPQRLLRGCLAKVAVRSHRGKKHTLAALGPPLDQRFAGKTIDGRWARLEHLPEGTRPRDLLEAVAEVEPALATPRWQPFSGTRDISVVGVVFTEELAQGRFGDSWLFLVCLRDRSTGYESRSVARGERLAAADISARLPERARLDDWTLGLIGLGSLGAPLAVEFLRTQVGELRVLDFDAVEAGNAVRWTHGLTAVGYQKTGVIAGWGAAEYPFTKMQAFQHRIGAVPVPVEPVPDGLGEADGLDQFLDGLDLVIDATGELGIQHLLTTLARPLGLPQVFAWATEGGWGGAVAAVAPASGGCWMCLQLAFDDGTIALPPGAPDPPVQPRGCADATFAAAGYDITPISAQAARTAARLLHGDGAGEVHVCTLQDDEGEFAAPSWVSSAIPVHELCPCEHAISMV